VPIAFRTFDVQFIIPDDRVLATPRPDLWRVRSDEQLYATELHSESLHSGPALSFAAHTPEMHHFKGSSGGRVLPLYASADTSRPNLPPGLLDLLTARLGLPVTPVDVLAYIAAVTAHPAFTARFAEDMRTPGIRVPLTADPGVWADAVELGKRVLWLHTGAERCTGPGRPPGPPEVMDQERRPLLVTAIPALPLPDDLTYDPTTKTLRIGDGSAAPVEQRVAEYTVGGTHVLRKWFGYRRATRTQARGDQSPLDDVRPTEWPAEYTTDLLELLHTLTLVTDLEPAQAELLDRVMSGPRITVEDLTAAGVFPIPEKARSLPKSTDDDPVQGLWAMDNDARRSR
jgi:hypothetical protein